MNSINGFNKCSIFQEIEVGDEVFFQLKIHSPLAIFTGARDVSRLRMVNKETKNGA